jgi:prolyl oligopeptidase
MDQATATVTSHEVAASTPATSTPATPVPTTLHPTMPSSGTRKTGSPDQLARHDWLEAQDSPVVRAWAARHDARCRTYLAGLAADAPVRARLSELLAVDERWVPVSKGGVRLEHRQAAGEQRPSLWVTDEGGERCIVDAASLDDDGLTAIGAADLSPDGSLLAWTTARAGVDWVTVRFRDTRTGEDLPDVLTGIKWAQFAWVGTEAIAYLALAEPGADEDLLALNADPRIKLHTFGRPQSEDEVVFEPTDAVWALPHTSSDGRWFVVEEQVGIVPARLHVRPVGSDGAWHTVVDGLGPIHFLGMVGDELVCLDFRDAPNGRVVAIDRRDGTERVVLAEQDRALEPYGAGLAADQVVTSRHGVAGSVVEVTPLAGGQLQLLLETESAIVRDLSTAGDEPVAYVHVERCDSEPGSEIVCHDLAVGTAEVLHRTRLPARGDVVVETVHATSADGTRVPMRVIRAAGPRPDGDAKVLLSVYGGYSVPFLTTGYESWHRVWLDAGGVLAYAGIRGGGELGEEWHLAATRTDKQRGIDDLIACTAWFEQQGWAGPRSVALNGMSNGGLMVGTVLTQRPDLLGAAIPEVGVFDLLRFHLFTAGHGWVREFGDVDVPAERAALEAYSPLHRITGGAPYPPTLVLTADRDDRVPPGPHSYRFFAALQDAMGVDATVHLRVAHNAGHAAGRTLAERIDERAAVLAFAAEAMALPVPADLCTTTSDKESA